MGEATREGRTERLELADPLLRDFEAVVLASDAEDGIVLDRSAFYPGGGGQPPDHGVLLWGGVQTRIVGARKGDDLALLPAEGDPLPPAGTVVRGAIEDERRTALMRTHSALHLLSGVVFRDFHALVTGSTWSRSRPAGLRPGVGAAGVPRRRRGRVRRRGRGRPRDLRLQPAARRGARDPGRHPHLVGAAPRRTWRSSGWSTSPGWTCSRTAARTWPRPAWSAGCAW